VLSPFLGILGDVNRTERLYAIAEELRAAGRAGRTSTWLARRLEVSARTVKRDVDALLQAGADLGTAGRGGGYVLEAGLPPLNVTAAEAAAIAVALAALPPSLRGGCPLRTVQGPRSDDRQERERAEAIAGRLWLRTPERAPRPQVARVLDEAVRERRVVVLDYADSTGAATRRAAEPVALAATGGHWYLLAWCRLRRGPRWFRTDRITALISPPRRTRTRRGDAVRHSARRRAPVRLR
jgi:predicted DNA-binding transcriptional regulator YafY